MTEKRLNNVMLCHVHKEELDLVNLEEIASMFVSVKSHILAH